MDEEQTTDDQLIQDTLHGIFDNMTCPEDDDFNLPDLDWVSTFAENGVLTTDKGLVIRLNDGREYQITIVQSR